MTIIKDYVAIEKVNGNRVNKYLNDGWEIIDKEKNVEPPEDSINYDVGLPAKTLLKKYREIIIDYEYAGLKRELFKKKASDYDKNINDYEKQGWGKRDEVSEYLNKYEWLMYGESASYTRKRQNTDVDEDWF